MSSTNSEPSPKHQVFSQFAAVAKALGHANRLEILEYLAQGTFSVDALAGKSSLTVGNVSQHLQHLKRAGLVISRREGKQIFYSLADDAVIDVMASLRQLAERNVAEVQRVRDGYFRERDALEPISREELLTRMKDGSATVLDVRPEDEFDAGHIPGSLNIPVADLEKALDSLSDATEVIAYCRGPYCVFSFETVAYLRERGIKARRLEDGYPEWKAAGNPVEG